MVEAALLVPVLGLIVVFAITAMRLQIARQALDAAAHGGARAASQAHDPQDAIAAARRSIRAGLDGQGIACRGGPAVHIDVSGFGLPAGQPATVTVTVRCLVDLSDVAIPGEPGTTTLTASYASSLDQYSERKP